MPVDFGPGREALLISPPVDDDNLVALIPGLGEGQVWEFRHDDVVAFASFAAFLHDLTRRARASVEQRAARLATGSDPNPRRRIIDLAHAGDPLAVDLACRAFAEPSSPDEQRFAANHPSGHLATSPSARRVRSPSDAVDPIGFAAPAGPWSGACHLVRGR